MPATTHTRHRAPLWPMALPLAGLLLLIPFVARAPGGLHPHGTECLWLALAALLAGAGWSFARSRR